MNARAILVMLYISYLALYLAVTALGFDVNAIWEADWWKHDLRALWEMGRQI